MLYATLKAIHLLAVVAWVGGMAFMLFCLRPAAAVLEPPARVTLMHAAMSRFSTLVTVAAATVFVSGAAMIGIAWSASARASLPFNMPLDWYVMVGLFFFMLAVFMHVRIVLFARLAKAAASQRWSEGAAALGAIRWEVTLNLVVGVFIIVLVRLGGTA
ncbi:MAG: CopD family protein [Caldimonas sp.]